MLTHCMFCHRPLGGNDVLERFPVGKRVAFDAQRGRLWAVCSSCQRWNLAPIEERWEALEDLERLTRDRGRLLSQTENIALIRTENIDIVHVGRAPLAEEAWWRYGRELRRRRTQNQIVNAAQWAAMIGLAFAAGFGGGYFFGGNPLGKTIRWLRFGGTAWRGEARCRQCGNVLQAVSFAAGNHLRLTAATTDEKFAVELRCKKCGFHNARGGYRFIDEDAQRLMRRVLAFYHYSGARDAVIKDAARNIEQAGSVEAFLKSLSHQQYRVRQGKENPVAGIALEIAVNDQAERDLLQLELADLESHWREEEELAGIIDGELTHLPALEKLRLKLR
jgi:hypothetical protein